MMKKGYFFGRRAVTRTISELTAVFDLEMETII